MPGKFNRPQVRPAAAGPLQTEQVPSGHTALGHPGYAREEKTELFTLGVSNFVSEDSFHESGFSRDRRFTSLVRSVAVADFPWLCGFLHWLRTDGNMRSAPVVGAAEAVHARIEARTQPYGRALVDSVLQRPDEPGEIWAYWLATYGRRTPHAFQRGIADAVGRLYTERALLRYDSPERALRFGDVIELSRPRYNNEDYGTWRDALYRYAIMHRHGRDIAESAEGSMLRSLPKITAARRIFAMPVKERRAFLTSPGGALAIEDAGIKWESVAGWLQGPMDADAWSACIPAMGFMALIRNLRNFDEAGVPDGVVQPVIEMLSDPIAVAGSRQFPFRFLAAHRAARSPRWAYPLEKALTASLSNVPPLPGRTLILVDRSLSMWGRKMSKRSTMEWADGAAIFGAGLAVRAADPTLIEFSGKSGEVRFHKADSVLKLADSFGRGDGNGRLSSGTDIPSAVRQHFRGHDRVIIITDEQTQAGYLPSNMHHGYGGMPPTEINALIPETTPVYMWNFGGYEYGALPVGRNRHLFAGLADGAFRQLGLLDRGWDTDWPWVPPAVPSAFPPPAVRTARRG